MPFDKSKFASDATSTYCLALAPAVPKMNRQIYAIPGIRAEVVGASDTSLVGSLAGAAQLFAVHASGRLASSLSAASFRAPTALL